MPFARNQRQRRRARRDGRRDRVARSPTRAAPPRSTASRRAAGARAAATPGASSSRFAKPQKTCRITSDSTTPASIEARAARRCGTRSARPAPRPARRHRRRGSGAARAGGAGSDVGEKSCCSPSASVRTGNSVLPSGAATAPVVAISTRPTSATIIRTGEVVPALPARGRGVGPARRERERSEQGEGVDQVRDHRERARARGVVRDQAEQHEPRTEQRLADHECRARGDPESAAGRPPAARHVQTTSPTTSSSAIPLVARCVNSIRSRPPALAAGPRRCTAASGRRSRRPEPVART